MPLEILKVVEGDNSVSDICTPVCRSPGSQEQNPIQDA